MTVLCVLLAGGAGAAARFGVDGALRAWRTTAFPWATLLVNATGSLLLGVLTGLAAAHGAAGGAGTVLAVGGTGFCGGYTTFSTASFETVRLLQQARYAAAAGNAAGSLLLTVVAAAAGLALAGG